MPKSWTTNSNDSTNDNEPIDFNEVTKWQINDMKETRERWAKEKAEKQTKAASSLKK